MKPRRAFTLIEVIVAAVIIGVLMAILLAAIQAAREAASRSRCVGNLRQIGLAMHQYQSREGVFPAAANDLDRYPGRPAIAHVQSAFTRILPELEQFTLFNSINYQVSQTEDQLAAENATAGSFTINVFLCPSDRTVGRMEPAAINYRLNLGSSLVITERFTPPGQVGAFTFARSLGPADFRDGMSMTAMVSERLRGDSDPMQWHRRRDPWFASLLASWPMPSDDAVARCDQPPDSNPPHWSFGGSSWFFFNFNHTYYNHVTVPNTSSFDCAATFPKDGARGVADAGIYAARSDHGSGVNLLTADGSVHFAKSSIDVKVWRALGTRAGGEIVDSPF